MKNYVHFSFQFFTVCILCAIDDGDGQAAEQLLPLVYEELLGISRATAKRHWAYARAWLYAEISDPEDPSRE